MQLERSAELQSFGHTALVSTPAGGITIQGLIERSNETDEANDRILADAKAVSSDKLLRRHPERLPDFLEMNVIK